ncbi:hypothetical protein M8C21_012937, partial [Ambrosia artemisiifolia]
MQSRTGLIEAIVFEVKDTERIGGNFLKNSSNVLCCNPKLSADRSCTVGEVIIQKDENNPDWPKRIQTFFDGNNQEAKMPTQSVEINKTGMYYLYFMYCDPQFKGTTISGKTVWRNADGYLPGKMVPLMTFYGFISLAYLILGLAWFLRLYSFGKCDHLTCGYYNMGNCFLVTAFGGGNGIWCGEARTRWHDLKSVDSWFCIFFCLNLGTIDDFSGRTKLYLVLPVAFLDTWFILWIFSSLSKTLEKLQMRRSIAKLDVYRKFTNALALFVLVSIA